MTWSPSWRRSRARSTGNRHSRSSHASGSSRARPGRTETRLELSGLSRAGESEARGPKIQPKWIQAYDKIMEVILHGQYSMGRYRDTDGGMSELPLLGAQHIDRIPDVRDGLTREERVVLYV